MMTSLLKSFYEFLYLQNEISVDWRRQAVDVGLGWSQLTAVLLYR